VLVRRQLSWNAPRARITWIVPFAALFLTVMQTVSPAQGSIPKVAGARCSRSSDSLGANLPLNWSNERATEIIDVDGVLNDVSAPPGAWIYETREGALFMQYVTPQGREALAHALSAVHAREALAFAPQSGSVSGAFYPLAGGRPLKAELLRQHLLAPCFAKGPVKGL
jgi:hypothetical protein